jgi:tetratricopeptide (TPR) repeat protein
MNDESSRIGDRWVALTDDGSPEARAGALLRQAVLNDPIDASRLAPIRDRLRRARRWPQRHWALRFAIAIGLLLSGGALTAAGQRYLHLFAPASPLPPQERTPAAPRVPHARTGAKARSVALVPPTEIVEPSPQAETVATPPHGEQAKQAEIVRPPQDEAAVPPRAAAVAARQVAAPPTPGRPSAPLVPPTFEPLPATPSAAPAPASALAQESKLLTEVLRKLRQDGDARGALALLDEHDARFASGALAPEATLARIEALIKTRRNGDALALLDRTAPSPRGSGRDLLIARAELRAAAGRCATAAADFDQLLQSDPARDSITERALWGRAACRAAAGDAAAARKDVQDYLAVFPEGRFAGEARATLAP